MTDTGQVTGRIVDAAHPTQPVTTAVIQIGVQTMRLSPSDNGGFVLQNVPTGTQPVSINSPGFSPYNGQVVVRKDQASDLGTIALAPIGP